VRATQYYGNRATSITAAAGPGITATRQPGNQATAATRQPGNPSCRKYRLPGITPTPKDALPRLAVGSQYVLPESRSGAGRVCRPCSSNRARSYAQPPVLRALTCRAELATCRWRVGMIPG
jgi:hypothetical protein